MKQFLFFLAISIIFLSFAGFALAAGDGIGVTLPNPLAGSGVTDFPTLIRKISEFITGIVASLAIIMFVWAGILFVTSAGNPGKIEQAKKALLYAIIGVAVVLAASGLIAVITAVIGG